MFQLRAPAVPLVVHDPYFSIWLPGDDLVNGMGQHWTGHPMRFGGAVWIDGERYLLISSLAKAKKLNRAACNVWPTRTEYVYEEAGVRLLVRYTTPVLPHRLDVLARPVTYITCQAESMDGKEHDVVFSFYYSGAPAVDRIYDKVNWGRFSHPEYDLIYFTASSPKMLETSGDDQRIEWGNFYIGLPKADKHEHVFRIGDGIWDFRAFTMEGKIVDTPDRTDGPKQCFDKPDTPAACLTVSLKCSAGKRDSSSHILAYDDLYSIVYMGQKLRGYWYKFNASFNDLLYKVAAEHEQLEAECQKYDEEFYADAAKAGGEKYAALCSLCFRQAIGAHKLVAAPDGTPFFLSKENNSNGCIATVDVTYPSAPLFLLTNPELLRGMLIPILDYAASPVWPFDFAPHDLGTYPLANGQVYGGGSRSEYNQMPVEECGNMLLLCAMLDKYAGKDVLVDKYANTVLKTWADYLMKFGFNPDDQLCTDDFAGRLAHNVNLSVKAILGLAAYADILNRRGDAAAGTYRRAAEKWAQDWQSLQDADHSRLTFDLPGSWSQKYNLVWDKLLNLNVFPAEVFEKEMAYYKTKLNKYGLPLDSRKGYTKLDWTVWCAVLTGKREDFDAIMEPLYRWVADTVDRVPLSDWYETEEPRMVRFKARSVVGGVFIKMLFDQNLLDKYAGKLKKIAVK